MALRGLHDVRIYYRRGTDEFGIPDYRPIPPSRLRRLLGRLDLSKVYILVEGDEEDLRRLG